MIYTVYVLRLRGDTEPRYIGQTCRTLDARLLGHMRAAAGCPAPVPFFDWLLSNGDAVEISELAHFDTREEARQVERFIISLCVDRGDPLFNRHHVPAANRINRPDAQSAQAAA